MMIFADPLEDQDRVPDGADPEVFVVRPGMDARSVPADRQVVRFTEGVHEVGEWTVPSHLRQIYLPGGAFVQGALLILDPPEGGFLLNGRGTLSSRSMPWHTPSQAGLTRYVKGLTLGGSHVTVEGITIADSPDHGVVGDGSHHHIDRVKVLGWKYNNDGIRGYAHSLIENSFIRANDDAIWLYDDGVTVRDCVFWQLDNGAVFQLGWSSQQARDVTVRDIDVIHAEWERDNRNMNSGVVNLRLRETDRPVRLQENYLFENITLETPAMVGIDLRMINTVGKAGAPHRIRDFTFRNVSLQVAGEDGWSKNFILPWDEDHGFENVVFENLRVNGRLVTRDNYAAAGRFDISPLAQAAVRFETGVETFRYQNPIAGGPERIRDPFILPLDGRWYMTGTYWEDEGGARRWPGVMLWSSDDLLDWRQEGIILENASVPWFSERLWAPEILFHPHRNRFYLTFNGLSHEAERQCVGLAVADRVTGPYTLLTADEPLTCVNDASLFLDDDGRTYLLQTGITIAEVDLDAAKLLHHKVKVLSGNAEDGHWDSAINEGPYLIKQNGVYYLFWSATGWGYHVGYATSREIYGPYTPHFRNPVYGASKPAFEAVSGEHPDNPFDELGHGSPFRGPDGRWWLSSHGYSHEEGPYRAPRLVIDPMDFHQETGEFTATPSWTPQTVIVPTDAPGPR